MGYRLGRHVEHDERSRQYNVVTSFSDKIHAWFSGRSNTVTYQWKRYSPILDQGQLGSCTGNAMTGWLGCAPYSSTVVGAAVFNEDYAVRLYELATTLDSFPGDYPPNDTGSSGLAVAKAAQQLKLISSYGHAFTTAALVYALRSGPVIVGVPWYEGFFSPDPDGMIHPSGNVVGGHEFLIRGYHAGVFYADNSWGMSWGNQGTFRFTTATWEALRKQQADVTVPRI